MPGSNVCKAVNADPDCRNKAQTRPATRKQGTTPNVKILHARVKNIVRGVCWESREIGVVHGARSCIEGFVMKNLSSVRCRRFNLIPEEDLGNYCFVPKEIAREGNENLSIGFPKAFRFCQLGSFSILKNENLRSTFV